MQNPPASNHEQDTPPSVLAALRELYPNRRLTVSAALRGAERQANRMLALSGITDAPVPTEIIESLPRIIIEYDYAMPGVASGASDWDVRRHSWIITLNPAEPDTRVRLTTCHEYKHILDHGKPSLLGDPGRRYYGRPAAEYVADYFGGCLLMPKRLLIRAWFGGVRVLDDLATMFDVSTAAMSVRLHQLGLVKTADHLVAPRFSQSTCTRRSRHRYQRPLSNDWPPPAATAEVVA